MQLTSREGRWPSVSGKTYGNTLLTDEGVQKLQQALPDCKIEY